MRDRQTLPMFPDLMPEPPAPKPPRAKRHQTPPTVLDAAEGQRRKVKGIAASHENSGEQFRAAALDAVHAAALKYSAFSTDQVWVELAGKASSPSNTAMGGVMRAAAAHGWIRPTNAYLPSEQPNNHRRPVRVWDSLVWKGGNDAV